MWTTVQKKRRISKIEFISAFWTTMTDVQMLTLKNAFHTITWIQLLQWKVNSKACLLWYSSWKLQTGLSSSFSVKKSFVQINSLLFSHRMAYLKTTSQALKPDTQRRPPWCLLLKLFGWQERTSDHLFLFSSAFDTVNQQILLSTLHDLVIIDTLWL